MSTTAQLELPTIKQVLFAPSELQLGEIVALEPGVGEPITVDCLRLVTALGMFSFDGIKGANRGVSDSKIYIKLPVGTKITFEVKK